MKSLKKKFKKWFMAIVSLSFSGQRGLILQLTLLKIEKKNCLCTVMFRQFSEMLHSIYMFFKVTFT